MIARLALHGVVSRDELLAHGIGRGSIARRLEAGRLHLIHRGVYAVGHPAISLHGRWRAAVLACGPGAVLSHRDAAHLWGIRQSARRDIDVTAPGRSRHRRRGITVHRPRTLHPGDVTVKDGIHVTTVARTVLDLADVVPTRQLRRAHEESQRLGLFDLANARSTLARATGRRGLGAFNALLAEALDAPPTKGELEARFHDLIRRHGLPVPQFNVALKGFEVDALWPGPRVAVELDSFAFHGRTREQHERDRVKQLRLQADGFEVVRVTWRMLEDDDAFAGDIRDVLSQRAALSRLRA